MTFYTNFSTFVGITHDQFKIFNKDFVKTALLKGFAERIRKLETWKAYINGLNAGQKGQ